jgi:hypothetical protein
MSYSSSGGPGQQKRNKRTHKPGPSAALKRAMLAKVTEDEMVATVEAMVETTVEATIEHEVSVAPVAPIDEETDPAPTPPPPEPT